MIAYLTEAGQAALAARLEAEETLRLMAEACYFGENDESEDWLDTEYWEDDDCGLD